MVLLNNGNGGYVSNATYEVGENPMSVIAADINGEGAMYNDMAQLGPLIQSFYDDRSELRSA